MLNNSDNYAFHLRRGGTRETTHGIVNKAKEVFNEPDVKSLDFLDE